MKLKDIIKTFAVGLLTLVGFPFILIYILGAITIDMLKSTKETKK